MSIALNELRVQNSIASGEKLIVAGATAEVQIDYDVLAKAIVEQWSGSTLAGSSQSVKSAIDAAQTTSETLNTNIAELQTRISQVASGTPEPVNTIAEMTDHSKIYVYTGSEQSESTGYWYSYDSTQEKFVPRGEYGGAVTDTTLSVSGAPADSKKVGDALAFKADADDVENLDDRVTTAEANVSELVDEEQIPATLTLIDGEYVNGSGAFIEYTGWSRTDYVKVTPGSTITIIATGSSQYNFRYDANKQPIGSKFSVNAGTQERTLGDNVEYVVFSAATANMNALIVYTGDTEKKLASSLPLTDTMKAEMGDAIEPLKAIDSVINPTAYIMKTLIPNYYFAMSETPIDKHDIGYLDDKINSIPDGYHFIFVTDTHYIDNAKQSVKLISYVRDRIGAKYVLFGGDILTAHNTSAIAYRRLCEFVHEFKNAFGSNFLPVVGNHDLNASSSAVDSKITYSDLVPAFMQGCDSRFHYCDFYDDRIDALGVSEGMTSEQVAKMKEYFRTCYYVDDIEGKTRYIVYNTGAGNYDGESGIQTFISEDVSSTFEEFLILEWLYDVLMSVPAGYKVVICSHIPCNVGWENPTDKPISSNRTALMYILLSFVRKMNASVYIPNTVSDIEKWCNRSLTFDFRDAPETGTVLIMGGHYHIDTFVAVGLGSNLGQSYIGGTQSDINATALTVAQSADELTTGHRRNEIPIIITQHDAYTKNSMARSHTMELGTITEQVVDVVTIKDNGDIALTRIGAGNDRYVTVE